MSTDRITKQVILKAPLRRVWEAISDPAQFGAWFGAAIDGPFAAGQDAAGHIEPTTVDADVARLQEPHRGVPFRIHIEQVEPMRLFAFRWHPYAIDPEVDYSGEPTTLVQFELEDADGGVVLTITESGFDALPADRRAAAREANDGGWEHQTRLIARYLARDGTAR